MKRSVKDYFATKIGHKLPYTLIDVGAMGGVPLKWDKVIDIINIIAFEPDSREYSKLKDNNNIRYFNCALNKKSENLTYFITKGHGKSSCFETNLNLLSDFEDSFRFEIVRKEIIPSKRVRNLDSIMEEDTILDIDFIKLDTQGSELSILEGGQSKLLPRLFGAQVEVEFIEMYRHQPLFRHIDQFMSDNGFQLIDLRRHYWKRKDYNDYRGKGQLIYADALYFKDISKLANDLSDYDSTEAKIKLLKAIMTCLLYKMFDYAVSLASMGLKSGYLQKAEHDELVAQIKKCSSKGLFKLNGRIYNRLYSLLQKIRPPSYLGWADSDQEIGNIKDV